VANTGDRPGSAVVQLYVGEPGSSARRPVRELRAFAKVHLGAGGSTDVRLRLTMRHLACWDRRSGRWVADPGERLLWAGTSSRALSQPTTVVLTERWTAPASGPTHPG